MQQSFFAPPKPAAPELPKNCTIIYRPKGRAREYAALACNVYRGCDHECSYCYAPSATRRTAEQFAASMLRPGFIRKLEKEAAKYQAAGITGKVLLSFTCDPYQRLDAQEKITRQAIKILHRHGLNIQVLTKGGSRALRDLDLFGPDDAFATTLTFLYSEPSLDWEPYAAEPHDRIETIRKFHAAGVPTWVSLEPVIDPAAALNIIRHTHAFVDLFKVGKMNYHTISKTVDWASFARDAIKLLKSLGKPFYIKKDLAAYL
jgi:DNA repair photolyase